MFTHAVAYIFLWRRFDVHSGWLGSIKSLAKAFSSAKNRFLFYHPGRGQINNAFRYLYQVAKCMAFMKCGPEETGTSSVLRKNGTIPEFIACILLNEIFQMKYLLDFCSYSNTFYTFQWCPCRSQLQISVKCE